MSSILPQSELLQRISPSSAVLRRERAPMARLESAAQPYLSPEDRIFLKIDTQGFEPQVLAGAGSLMARLCGVQLEMSLVPCYEGEIGFREMLDRLAAAGFEPYLFIPGYFERKLGRQLQLDGVFMREAALPPI
jgi:Methyltransferase FkbM domain